MTLEAAEKQRALLLDRQKRFDVEIARDFGRLWARTKNKVADAGPLSRKSIRSLADDIAADVDRFSKLLERKLKLHQAKVIRLAGDHATDDVRGMGKAKSRIRTAETKDLLGALSNGKPLRTLLQELGPEARTLALQGLRVGFLTRRTYDDLRERLGITLTRAITIGQTEGIRTYREVQRRTYEENADVVPGWIWISRRNKRTCGACWAMHGTWHPADEGLNSHPRCKCVAMPAARADARKVKKGSEVFRALPAVDQEEILGPGKYAAYKAGDIKLKDLIHQERGGEWPPLIRDAALKNVV